jgi:histidyl-tRNA synthetase
MSKKPSTPAGVRDFLPAEVRKRNHIIHTLKDVFEQFAYQPIETPTLEHLETLMGKYGEEGDRLIFKVLPRGEKLGKLLESVAQAVPNQFQKAFMGGVEEAMRYDLTVPFARFVVQHRNDLTLPFKRYQIQPVWRADRPQKGRFREFYQCDADVVGSRSLWQEVELVGIYDTAFARLNVPVVIKVNHRKVLAGLAEVMGAPERMIDLTVALDKLDKIGRERVEAELLERGFAAASIARLAPVFEAEPGSEGAFQAFQVLLQHSAVGQEGLAELQWLFDHLGGTKARVEFDITLARGLNYYTGCIFEVKAIGVELGSIGGGGRYDDLTGLFGWKDLPGVGISFGLDRIYLAMEELNCFPEDARTGTQVLVAHFSEEEAPYAFECASYLRQNGIRCDFYPEPTKLGKQMQFAEKSGIPFVLLAGKEEASRASVLIKDLATGHQLEMKLDQVVRWLDQPADAGNDQ